MSYFRTGDLTIEGDQVGIQYNYPTSPELQALIAELNTTLVDLQTQNPTVATESQALTIIDAEGLYHRFGHRGASRPSEELAKTWGHTGL